jgi:hypothetical protein
VLLKRPERLAAIKSSASSKVSKYQSNWKIGTKGDGKLVNFGMESYSAFNKDAEETMQFVGGIKYRTILMGCEASLFATSDGAFRWRTLKGTMECIGSS